MHRISKNGARSSSMPLVAQMMRIRVPVMQPAEASHPTCLGPEPGAAAVGWKMGVFTRRQGAYGGRKATGGSS